MSFFSSDAFLSAVAQAYHPGRHFTIELVRIGDAVYRLLVVGGHPTTHVPFLDYVEPEPNGISARRAHAWMPRAVRGVVRAEGLAQGRLPGPFEPSPFVNWPQFAAWAAFLESVHRRTPYPFGVTARKRRKIARELGPLSFVADSPDTELLDLCFGWKSAQYRRTSLPDLFVHLAPRAFFRELFEQRVLSLSALLAGGRPVALHAGVVWDRRFYYWLPAHDPELNSY